MKTLHKAMVALMVCLISAAAHAQPAKQDLSEPKAAATALFDAMLNGDVKAAQAAALDDKANQDIVAAMATMVNGMKQMHDAAAEKFGAEAAAAAGGGNPAEELKKIRDNSEVTIEGDTAKLQVPNEGQPLVLKNVNGQWRADLTSVMPAGQVEQATPMFMSMGAAGKEIAAEIRADKYPTIKEAQDAFGQRMFAAMMEAAHKAGATPTAPSTQPVE